MNKQQLASKIWASANKMRSNIEASEYKDYILGFIFYKFLSEKEENYLLDHDWTRDDFKDGLVENEEQVVEYCKDNIGYFISYENLFSTWHKIGNSFDIQRVKDALSAFSRNIAPEFKNVFEDIFVTLDTGISKLGNNAQAQTKAVRSLIDLIDDIPMNEKHDYDVLGFIYEYLISNFAANAGKKAGEFYTPHEVSMLMSEIIAYHLRNKEKIEIYDPTSGSGSLLINIGDCVSKHMKNSNNIKYYAQEVIKATYNLTRMNLVMRGILPSNIITRCGDTLDKDWPFFDEKHNYAPLYVDAVVSNPPYSQNWEPEKHDGDIRFSSYGYAPKTKADYAFLLHDLYHLRPEGIMTIVLPHGVLFRGGEEAQIRKNLIENNNVDAVIGLPANIFFGTGIPTIIMILKKRRETNDVLIIDASKHFIKEGKNNKLQQSDIKRIVDTYISRSSIDKFSRVVSKNEIKDNEYNLNISRYVDSSEEKENIDLYATMFGGIPFAEINDLKNYWNLFPSLKDELFSKISDKPYGELKTSNIDETIKNNLDVKKFISSYNDYFSNFSEFLEDKLLKNITNDDVNNLENVISNEIFKKLENFTLIDKYAVYQKLDDTYKIIAQDLEIIQTEDVTAINKVDPHMVLKKKDNKEIEVQDGWEGHILPFDLIETKYFSVESMEIKEKNDRLNEIKAIYEETLDSLDDSEKDITVGEDGILTNSGDAFSSKGVKNYVKMLKKNHTPILEETIESKLVMVDKLIDEEKTIKKDIKLLEINLIESIKSKIETLPYTDCLDVLRDKWIKPILTFINNAPKLLVEKLIDKINYLSKKYEITLVDLTNEIKETEIDLSNMIDDLVGDEFDMKGLEEFKKLLVGDDYE